MTREIDEMRLKKYKRARGRPFKTWRYVIRKDISLNDLSEIITLGWN